jgi:hypothetical protein
VLKKSGLDQHVCGIESGESDRGIRREYAASLEMKATPATQVDRPG